MSRKVDTSDLGALSEDELLYLHGRNLINDDQLAEAAGVDVEQLREAFRKQAVTQPSLDDIPQAGDADTIGDENIVGARPPQSRIAAAGGDSDQYSDLSKKELRAIIDERNAERDEEDLIEVSGTKETLADRLRADDNQ